PDLFNAFPSFVRLFTSNGIVAGSVTAITLNIIFNMIPHRKDKKVADPEPQHAK
ncbi:purine permease, partial [Escherichia coli]|nr:purine permease [Escherichia coli]